MFFWKNRNKKHFTVRFPEESREVCTNPGRGWYHIYTFTLDKREKDGLLYQPYWDDETLVLVRFDIGAFRGMSLSEEALEYADEILKCFHSRGKEIIACAACCCPLWQTDGFVYFLCFFLRLCKRIHPVCCKAFFTYFVKFCDSFHLFFLLSGHAKLTHLLRSTLIAEYLTDSVKKQFRYT